LFGLTVNAALPFGTSTMSLTTNQVKFPVGTIGRFLIVTRVNSGAGFTQFDGGSTATYTNCGPWSADGTGTTGSVVATLSTSGTGLTYTGFILVGVVITSSGTQAIVTLPTPTWTGTALNTFFKVVEM